MVKIGFDIMGGDYAPLNELNAVVQFLEKNSDAHIVAIGDADAIAAHLANTPKDRYTIVPTTEVIGMDDNPTRAMKEKPNSSINAGFHMLAKGDIDAFVSAGNTGVMLVGAAHIIKVVDGVQRPSIPTFVPNVNGGTSILLDVGINADCKPEVLEQFGILGSVYAEQVLNITNPKVGLLNIGEEEGKGNLLAKATFPLLQENKNINFIGNIEGRDVLAGKADVIITDGFTGNIVLKLCESFYTIIKRDRKINDDYINRLNYENYGGTPVLGVNKTVIVGHGISSPIALANMLQQACDIAKSNLPKLVKAKIAVN